MNICDSKRRMNLALILIAICFFIITPVSAAKANIIDPKEIAQCNAVIANVPISVDGSITDKEWGKATVLNNFMDIQSTGRPIPKTSARIMWDDENLYFAFECEDTDMWNKAVKRDADLYNGDVVEMFIDPYGTGIRYLEIEISPSNNILDMLIIKPDWLSELTISIFSRYDVRSIRSAVKANGTINSTGDKDIGWSVEAAIPWIEFAKYKINLPPKDGDTLRVQLFRMEYSAAGNPLFISWSKSPNVFHEPANFGIVTFRR